MFDEQLSDPFEFNQEPLRHNQSGVLYVEVQRIRDVSFSTGVQ